ncbi:MAG TPA: hypothetical protein DEA75_20580 [Rhodobacteraceae bacterium]|nr:hypothetical protein [Paracoccaceae bacterium]
MYGTIRSVHTARSCGAVSDRGREADRTLGCAEPIALTTKRYDAAQPLATCHLPIATKSSQTLTEDDVKIAAVFLPLAKRRCDTHGADWTTDLISATVNSLETLIGP